MPDTDQEVFEYFRAAPDASAEVASLAYAAYAFDKYEWVKRQTEVRGTAPDPSEIDAWINGLPESRLDGILGQAADLFDQAARAYLEDDIEKATARAARKAITNEIIQSNRRVIRRVRSATSYWRNFPGALFVGFVSSIVFVIVVGLCSWAFEADPSPFAVIKGALSHSGKANSPAATH